MPRTLVLTLLVVTIRLVMFPSTLSNAVAPGSVYEVPLLIEIEALPIKVMTGRIVSPAGVAVGGTGVGVAGTGVDVLVGSGVGVLDGIGVKVELAVADGVGVKVAVAV